ncbi:hypothetical protein C8Q73DRAFT_51120 [Cubamyces lactineus]|nr:hypothetical protein C8Q73DRAFT_51120 [Cubamyces lactineus]
MLSVVLDFGCFGAAPLVQSRQWAGTWTCAEESLRRGSVESRTQLLQLASATSAASAALYLPNASNPTVNMLRGSCSQGPMSHSAHGFSSRACLCNLVLCEIQNGMFVVLHGIPCQRKAALLSTQTSSASPVAFTDTGDSQKATWYRAPRSSRRDTPRRTHIAPTPLVLKRRTAPSRRLLAARPASHSSSASSPHSSSSSLSH